MPATADMKPVEKPAPPKQIALSPKELRRQRAMERDKARLENRQSEKSQMDQDKVKLRVEELSRQLSDPAIYADFAKVRQITEELNSLQKQ